VPGVRGGAARDDGGVRQFERDLLLMPDHVSVIRNWTLGHVVSRRDGARGRTCGEQDSTTSPGSSEYIDPPHPLGPSRLVHPECPQRIVDRS